jgi:hypothetical protein
MAARCLGLPLAKYAMAVPSTKLIVLNAVIIADRQIDTEERISTCREHGAALALDCFAAFI